MARRESLAAAGEVQTRDFVFEPVTGITYDERGDVLYLQAGDRREAAESLGTPRVMPSAMTTPAR